MKIEFVNHSSVLIKSKINILCDPWYCGTAFADGWRLLHDDKIDINTLKYDKIWLSHEHPDHFSIPTLKQISGQRSFIYQETIDKKVKSYLENRGHSVTEMHDNFTMRTDGLDLTTIVTEGYDSCLLVNDDGVKFLNINDSQLDRLDELEKIACHVPVDLIAIQFHYANWAGNPEDKLIPEMKRKAAVERVKKVAEFCGTKNVMLFASYVYYCHEENFYWNKPGAIRKTYEDLKSLGLNVIIPIPGDAIVLSDNNNIPWSVQKNEHNINFWENLISEKRAIERTKALEISEITDVYNKFHDKLAARNNLSKYLTTSLSDFHLVVNLVDKNKFIKLWLFEKRTEVEDGSHPDSAVSMTSDALNRALSADYGLGSITISSRLFFNYTKAYKLYFFFLIAYRNNIGIYLVNSISKDLNFEGFKNNGVLKPIFSSNYNAKEEFNDFISYLKRVDEFELDL